LIKHDSSETKWFIFERLIWITIISAPAFTFFLEDNDSLYEQNVTFCLYLSFGSKILMERR